MSSAPPGWYVDPGDPTQYRYWTGQAWSGAVAPVYADGVPAPATVAAATLPPAAPAAPAAPAVFPPAPPLPPEGFLASPYQTGTGMVPRRLDALTTALTVLFVAAAVVALASIAALANQQRVIDRIADGEDVTLSEANTADGLAGAALLLELALGLAIFVLIVVWLWRAYTNISVLGVGPTRYGRGFTIGAWFIPIGALFMPKQLINDCWRAADPSAPGNARWTKLPILKISTAWWLLYIAATFVFPQGFSDAESSVDEVSRSITAAIISAVLIVAACICGAITFRRIAARQHDRLGLAV